MACLHDYYNTKVVMCYLIQQNVTKCVYIIKILIIEILKTEMRHDQHNKLADSNF